MHGKGRQVCLAADDVTQLREGIGFLTEHIQAARSPPGKRLAPSGIAGLGAKLEAELGVGIQKTAEYQRSWEGVYLLG